MTEPYDQDSVIDRAEEEYQQWCREVGLDPMDVDSMLAYESDFDDEEWSNW